MSAHRMHLAGVYRPRPDSAGFAIPVFRDERGFWVQESSANGTIAGFRRCDVDVPSIIPLPAEHSGAAADAEGGHACSETRSRRVGEPRLYAFCFPDSSVAVGERATLASLIRKALPMESLGPFGLTDVAEFLQDNRLLKLALKHTQMLIPGFDDPVIAARMASRRRRQLTWIGLAAAVVVAIGIEVQIDGIGPGGRPRDEVFETQVAQHEKVVLPDRSQIQLGARSSVTSAISGSVRFIVLDRGEAVFNVAHDPTRPFRVLAGAGVITAVGTEFNIHRVQDLITVTVSAGTVEVAPASPATAREGGDQQRGKRVSVGEYITYDSAGKMGEVRTADLDVAMSWRRGLLQYGSVPLYRVVEDVNRYSRKTIVIADAAAAERLYSGTVFERDIDDWIEALPETFGGAIEVTEPDSTHVVIRSR